MGRTRPSPKPQEALMGENLDNATGRVKQAAGDLTDNDDLKAEGKADEASGKAKGILDDLKDKAEGAVDAVKDKVDELRKH
jgi:uncharacterized protein YjbJ (UPF0337 family)